MTLQYSDFCAKNIESVWKKNSYTLTHTPGYGWQHSRKKDCTIYTKRNVMSEMTNILMFGPKIYGECQERWLEIEGSQCKQRCYNLPFYHHQRQHPSSPPLSHTHVWCQWFFAFKCDTECALRRSNASRKNSNKNCCEWNGAVEQRECEWDRSRSVCMSDVSKIVCGLISITCDVTACTSTLLRQHPPPLKSLDFTACHLDSILLLNVTFLLNLSCSVFDLFVRL